MFQYGDKSYGTYAMKEDPTVIPKDEELAEEMTSRGGREFGH